MTLTEVSEIFKRKGFTAETLDMLDKAVEEGDWGSYKDPDILRLFKTVTSMDYEDRIQKSIGRLVDKMYNKGINPPCMSGCDPDCPFKEFE